MCIFKANFRNGALIIMKVLKVEKMKICDLRIYNFGTPLIINPQFFSLR